MNKTLMTIIYIMFAATILCFLAYLVIKAEWLGFAAGAGCVAASAVYLTGKKIASHKTKK